LIERGFKADEWIKAVSDPINGKGGGKSNTAQAVGINVANIDEAIKVAIEFAKSRI
jgi:alanyl-tRNA synthetase